LCLPSATEEEEKTNLNLPNSKPIKIDLRGRFILTSPSLWSDLTTTKRGRDRRNLFHDGNIIPTLMSPFRTCLDVAVQKPNSPCRHVKEVANAVAAIIIFIEATMERPNPPFLLSIVGEEEETNPQYQKTWHREINPKLGLDLLKLL
jgi:hypothetical protein